MTSYADDQNEVVMMQAGADDSVGGQEAGMKLKGGGDKVCMLY